MKKTLSIFTVVLLLSLKASSGQFGMSTPLRTNALGQVTFVQARVNNTGTSGLFNCDVTLPSSVVAGHMLLIYGGPSTTSSVTDTLGNSYTLIGANSGAGGVPIESLWMATNVAGGSDVITMVGAGEVPNCLAAEFKNVALSSPIDGTPYFLGQAGASTIALGPTTTAAGSSKVLSVVLGCTSLSLQPTSWTMDWNGQSSQSPPYDSCLAEIQPGAAGSVSGTWTVSSAYTNGVIFGVKLL